MADGVDGTHALLVDTDLWTYDSDQRRRHGVAEKAEGTEPDSEPAGDRIVECGIDRFQHESVDIEGPIAEERRRATHRHADDADALARSLRTQIRERRLGIETLERPEGDVSSGTLPVSLEVGGEDREARCMEEKSASEHAAAVAAHAVEEEHRTGALAPRHQPRVDRAPRLAGELHGARGEVRGRTAGRAGRGVGEHASGGKAGKHYAQQA